MAEKQGTTGWEYAELVTSSEVAVLASDAEAVTAFKANFHSAGSHEEMHWDFLVDGLNQLGQQGWELVTRDSDEDWSDESAVLVITTTYLFKRPLV